MPASDLSPVRHPCPPDSMEPGGPVIYAPFQALHLGLIRPLAPILATNHARLLADRGRTQQHDEAPPQVVQELRHVGCNRPCSCLAISVQQEQPVP